MLQLRLQQLQRENQHLHEMVLQSERTYQRYTDALAMLRETKAALEAKEALIEGILNAAMECIISIDCQGRIIEFNAAAETMLGYHREAVLGKDLSSLVIPSSLRDRHRQGLARLLQHGDGAWLNQRVETIAMRADGSEFPVELTITKVSQGDSPVFAAFIRDLSDKKQIEAALQQRVAEAEAAQASLQQALDALRISQRKIEQAKNEWEHTFDAVADPVFLHDEQGRLIRANRAYAEQAGMEMQAMIGRPYWEVFPVMDRPFDSTISVEQPCCEEKICMPDGRVFISSAYVVNDGNGNYLYSVHFMRDVTERVRMTRRLKQSLEGTIRAITAAVEARDPYTAGHQMRVGELAAAIARQMGLDEKTVEGIYLGGKIHDIGKIHLAVEILSKPTRLTELEYELVREHARIGYDILKDIKFPWPIADIAHQHHERLDGSGYPQGLKGEEICLEARIVAVADVVEAMATHRPYRPGLGIDRALEEIERGRGSHYDAEVADACLSLFREYKFSFDC